MWTKSIITLWLSYWAVLLYLIKGLNYDYTVLYTTQTVMTTLLAMWFYSLKGKLWDFWCVEMFHIVTLAWYQFYWAVWASTYNMPSEYIIAMLAYTASCFWLLLHLYNIQWNRFYKMTTWTTILLLTAWIWQFWFYWEWEFLAIFNIVNVLLLAPVSYKLIKSMRCWDMTQWFISNFILGVAWYQIYIAAYRFAEKLLWLEPVYGGIHTFIALLPFNISLFTLILYIILERFNKYK